MLYNCRHSWFTSAALRDGSSLHFAGARPFETKEMLNIYLGGIGEYIPVCRKEPNNAPESPMETTPLFAFDSIMELLIMATKVSKFFKC